MDLSKKKTMTICLAQFGQTFSSLLLSLECCLFLLCLLFVLQILVNRPLPQRSMHMHALRHAHAHAHTHTHKHSFCSKTRLPKSTFLQCHPSQLILELLLQEKTSLQLSEILDCHTSSHNVQFLYPKHELNDHSSRGVIRR